MWMNFSGAKFHAKFTLLRQVEEGIWQSSFRRDFFVSIENKKNFEPVILDGEIG